VIREAKEEAGIDLVESSLRVVHVMHRDSQQDRANERVDVFFLVDRWEGEIINQEPHKCDDLSRFLLSNLPENIIPYIAQVLAEVHAGHIYSEHGWTA
jgi:8-oxo-dGTP pyrophosphatase MutT (NUDIX family)